jgi:hypothetical protein
MYVHLMGGVWPTLEEVLEVVGWRGRAERGAKPTEIEKPSKIKRVYSAYE